MYESFLVEHEKFDYTPEEKKKRFEIFKNSVRFIDRHNSTAPAWNKLGLNSTADRMKEELCSRPILQPPLSICTPRPMVQEEEDPQPIWGEIPVSEDKIDAFNAWCLHRAAKEDQDQDQGQG
ncbi:hypothetical protein SSX86_030828 [Deinandra increscens subsp. villosa]|uniref:Cathepsin propeptide inhibitor domain-containing protein n=1 Tax=Deinandra increscens subsp. villosa TaxID=3103831 RepID=A0AAP0GIU7_9ASTR